jgi:hypothetical protein
LIVWNISLWVEKNIKYDHQWEQQLKSNTLYTGIKVTDPYTVVTTHKGICTSYTLLIDAMLLNNGFKKVYVIIMDFKNDRVGHAVAGVNLGGKIYALDQGDPPTYLDYYITHYQPNASRVQVIPVTLTPNGEVSVNPDEIMTINPKTTLLTPDLKVSAVEAFKSVAKNVELVNCTEIKSGITLPGDFIQGVGPDFFRILLKQTLGDVQFNQVKLCVNGTKIKVEVVG